MIAPTPALNPDDFAWYGDPTVEVVVGCYALGTGVGEPQLDAMGRQLAEEFAAVLRLHPAFVTVAQLLTVRDEAGATADRIRSAFAVFHSLPETRLIRAAARSLNARLALTGRLVGEGADLQLGVNLMDVERGTLLAVSHVSAPRDAILSMLTDTSVQLLRRFGDYDPKSLAPRIQAVVGTTSFHAFVNWATCRDQERRAAAGGALDRRRLIERLGFALQADPGYGKPLQRLVDLLDETGSEAELRQLARSLASVPLRRPGVGLVRGEALRRLGETDEARKALEEVIGLHPNTAQVYFLLGELEAVQRPKIARDYYKQAHLLDPRRALYRSKLE